MNEIDDNFTRYASTRNRHHLASLLKSLQPDMEKAITRSGGQVTPLTLGMAKRVVIDATESYKPDQKTSFRTWVNTQMQRLPRQMRDNKFVVKVPEMAAREAMDLRGAVAEIESETGFPPSDGQLSERLGLSVRRIRKLRGAITPEVLSEDAGDDDTKPEKPSQLVMDMVYHSSDPKDQVVLQHVFGYNGGRLLPGKDIAKRLGLTPAAVSLRVTKLQSKIDEAMTLV